MTALEEKKRQILYRSCTNYYLVLAIDIVCFSESYFYIIMVIINLLNFYNVFTCNKLFV